MDAAGENAADAVAEEDMISFPHIGGFRQFLKESARGRYIDANSVNLVGTVKLHGTHGDIVARAGQELQPQSRNRRITVSKDNMGFAKFVTDNSHLFSELVAMVRSQCGNEKATVFIAGEWCGGNIQKNVALMHLPRMFVVFNIVADSVHVPLLDFTELLSQERFTCQHIYTILIGPTFQLTVNLQDTAAAETALTAVTDSVDKACPFAAKLGAKGHGEGIVWKLAEHPYRSSLWFKTKGTSHEKSGVPKIKCEKEISPEMKEYMHRALTPRRLEQGLEYVREMHVQDMKHLLQFADWIVQDALREEDVGELDSALLQKRMRGQAIAWYKENLSYGL
jgi:hypothetical protein